ncbi:MAG: Panacea domain-containing protein [Candidatus Sericytochromatia bacterium]
MQKLVNILKYIYLNYPNIEQLSKPRLVKLVYLLDWKYCLTYENQVTDITWYFNHYGPYVEDVINLINQRSDLFQTKSYDTKFGIGHKITYIGDKNIELTNDVITALDFVIEKTNKLNWNQFISLVYDTYPIKSNSKYSKLNLIEDSKKYKSLVKS